MEQETIKILLANDHSLIRTGIKNALHKTSYIKVIEEACSFPDMFKKLEHWQPDILMTDDQMPGGYLPDELPLLKKLYPDLKIIANTFSCNAAYFSKAIPYANAVISLSSDAEDFIKAVNTVYHGGLYFHRPGFKRK